MAVSATKVAIIGFGACFPLCGAHVEAGFLFGDHYGYRRGLLVR